MGMTMGGRLFAYTARTVEMRITGEKDTFYMYVSKMSSLLISDYLGSQL
jgi:hypothetical protein